MQTKPVDFSIIQQYDTASLSHALRKLVPNDQSWSLLHYLMEYSFSNGSSMPLSLWDGRQALVDTDEYDPTLVALIRQPDIAEFSKLKRGSDEMYALHQRCEDCDTDLISIFISWAIFNGHVAIPNFKMKTELSIWW